MATDMDDDDPGPGLHVLREAAPLDRAGSLAARLGADLCVTLPEVDAIVAERRGLPDANADTLDALRVLAGRVAAADRIAERTHARAATEVADRMAAIGAGMAVHPTTIRERASAVERARTEVHQAEQMLEANDAVAEDPPPAEVVPFEPTPVIVAPRRRGLFGFLRRNRADEVEDTRESSDLLRSMAAATDEAFGARRASTARDDQRTLLLARRESATEDLRVAERAWHDLAGDDADPAQVEDVVRRLDPQHEDALLAAKATVSVRAASTVFDKAMARWQEAWAALDLDAPLPGEAVEAVDRLVGQVTKAIVLVGDAADRGLEVADAAPGAPVIVIEALLVADV